MKQSQWPLVSDLVKEGLSVAQMESVCHQAVAEKQWTVALQLLRDGVSASDWMVNELFQSNKAQHLLDLFPVGRIPEGLKGLLLMASVRFHLGDLALHILQRESVSDSHLMEAIKFSIHLLDKSVFLQLIRGCPKGRRVFKQKFVHQQWKESLQPSESDGGEVRWIFKALYDDGEKELALFVATSVKNSCPNIEDFCWGEWEQFALKPKKFSYALTKLFEFDRTNYHVFVEKMFKMSKGKASKSIRSFLFCQNIKLEEYNLTDELCKYNVPKPALKFAYWWLVQGERGEQEFSRICCMLSTRNCNWLCRYALKCSMEKYFEQRSDTSLKIFIGQYRNCSDEDFASQMFRKAITKCVELNDADCFVMLCKNHQRSVRYTRFYGGYEERAFAYTSAIEGNRLHFISKLCDEKFARHSCFDVVEMVELADIIIEREAWPMLDCVISSADYLHFEYRVIRLLERCVIKMLSDQSVWPHIAVALDNWMTRDVVWRDFKNMVISMNSKLATSQWSISVSSLLQWCVDNDHANLAFLLALITEQWETLTSVVIALPSLDPDKEAIWAAAYVAAERKKFSASAALLKLWPVNRDSVKVVWKRSRNITCLSDLVRACEEQGLLHWALVMMAESSPYVLEKHQPCQNPHVLNFLLKQAVKSCVFDIAGALAPRCTDGEVLEYVLKRAFLFGQKSLAEGVIGRVDPTVEDYDFGLFYGAVSSDPDVRLELVRLCISAGLSTFERERGGYVPVLSAFERSDLKVVKMLLASGALTHKQLQTLKENKQLQNRMQAILEEGSEDEDSEKWKKSYRCIAEAAATPCRLEHLARLVVSHSIGCEPGRSDRINSLPVAAPVKDLLNFKDVDISEEEL